MCDIDCSPKQNLLLNALPAKEYERIFPHLELVEMLLGNILCESGEALHFIHFPVNCIVSLVYVMENGASTEIAVVGKEGVIGIAVFMGGVSYHIVLWYRVQVIPTGYDRIYLCRNLTATASCFLRR